MSERRRNSARTRQLCAPSSGLGGAERLRKMFAFLNWVSSSYMAWRPSVVRERSWTSWRSKAEVAMKLNAGSRADRELALEAVCLLVLLVVPARA